MPRAVVPGVAAGPQRHSRSRRQQPHSGRGDEGAARRARRDRRWVHRP